MGLAVFSLSNERAGPKDRKYDPSRPHYKKVSLLRDRLIPAVGTTPTIIYSPFMEGTSGVKKTKEGNSLLWGCLLVGAPFGPRGSVAWVPVLGLSVVVGSLLLCAPTAPQQHNNNNNHTTPTPTPYSTSADLAYSTLQLFLLSHARPPG